jgi:hypothetical protein
VCSLVCSLAATTCIEQREVGWLPRCGNDQCDRDVDPGSGEGPETPATCPQDCRLRACGNGLCEGDERVTCVEDCPATLCGDGACEPGEDPYRCEIDCPWGRCENGACEPTETPETCPQDCYPGACGDALCEDFENAFRCPADCPPRQAADVLFVVDNSYSMAEEQWRLRQDFGALLAQIRRSFDGLPDLHVGVTSTDLGAAPFGGLQCEGDGDDGRLIHGPDAPLLGGPPWLIDVAPEGCAVLREPDGTCREHQCTAAHCAHRPETELVLEPAHGCPRCRNFSGPLTEAFGAAAALGTVGCGFEQPLEAMYRALWAQPENDGFLRADSVLVVIFVTDEDDCSASDPTLFDPRQTALDSPLGPFTSFRCFEFGVSCDVNVRTHQGLRRNCVPRVDANRKLYPLSRYTELMWREDRLDREPGQVVVAALAGPVVADQVEVGVDALHQPTVLPSCATADGSATPAVRLRAFTARFNDPWAMQQYAYQSICAESYVSPLRDIGRKIKERLGY